ncbi:hypothetical protein [Aquipuribacter sp. MA13-6]|uniref:hypothetical protein n=1 Tax=unclassified Aquipuribacter TaxID=2635084 RepID=UPI003EEB1896
MSETDELVQAALARVVDAVDHQRSILIADPNDAATLTERLHEAIARRDPGPLGWMPTVVVRSEQAQELLDRIPDRSTPASETANRRGR